ncbi:uncharacterized protein LOC143240973 isoform X3 [Tachypleus tridentatus]|uniref:uncharacterized protein LOC143237094 isoform X1 n=1 Tax=Tachypleus tridentatus TaxID=6853 RepID=UPI003FD57F3F
MQVPGEVDSLEESSLCTVMKFDVTREEQEEKCDDQHQLLSSATFHLPLVDIMQDYSGPHLTFSFFTVAHFTCLILFCCEWCFFSYSNLLHCFILEDYNGNCRDHRSILDVFCFLNKVHPRLYLFNVI